MVYFFFKWISKLKVDIQQVLDEGDIMDNYRVTVGVEPTNDYDKAKQDVMQAMISIRKLPLHQQRMLAEEFVGAANVTALLNIFQQAFGRQLPFS